MDKNVDDICNIVRKPYGKNTNVMPDSGQQISVVAQENLKPAVFLVYHWWRFIHDWEDMRFSEDPDMLPKVVKANMAVTTDVIKEYLR